MEAEASRVRKGVGVIHSILGALVGGLVVYFLQTQRLRFVPVGMDYSDIAAIALSAVSVLVTVLGVGLAVAAFWGYGQVKGASEKAAKRAARAVAKEEVESYMKGGEVDAFFRKEAIAVAEKLLTQEKLEEMILSRVDALIFGREADSDLDGSADQDSEGENNGQS